MTRGSDGASPSQLGAGALGSWYQRGLRAGAGRLEGAGTGLGAGGVTRKTDCCFGLDVGVTAANEEVAAIAGADGGGTAGRMML